MRGRNIAVLVLACWMATTLPAHGGPRGKEQGGEASMIVAGHVDIGADGLVSAHQVDGHSALPANVLDLVARASRHWRFEPRRVDGVATPVRARMSLRLLARPGEGGYRVSIASGSFSDTGERPTDDVMRGLLKAPEYPTDMSRRGVEGTVYLVLKVVGDGRVEDVATEQVNLLTYSPERNSGRYERDMERMRGSLAASAIEAAREWTFVAPSTGGQARNPYWVVRVPVSFSMQGTRAPAVGQWDMYLPGPRQPLPDWAGSVSPGDTDALAAGQLQTLGNQRRLLTPLEGG